MGTLSTDGTRYNRRALMLLYAACYAAQHSFYPLVAFVMSSSLAAALEALESAPHDLSALRRVAHRVTGVRDLSVLADAIALRTSVLPELSWRLWLGFSARAAELGSEGDRARGLEQAVANAPGEPRALTLLDACLDGEARSRAACRERLATLDSLEPAERRQWTEHALDAWTACRDSAGSLRMAVQLAAFDDAAGERAFSVVTALADTHGWTPEVAEGARTIASLRPTCAPAFQRVRWTFGERDAASLRATVEAAPEPEQLPLLHQTISETPSLRTTIARLAQSVWRSARDPGYLELAISALDANDQAEEATSFLVEEADALPDLERWVERWSAAAAAAAPGPERDSLHRLLARTRGNDHADGAMETWLALAASETVPAGERTAALRAATEAALQFGAEAPLDALIDALLPRTVDDPTGWALEWLDRLSEQRRLTDAQQMALRIVRAWPDAGPDLWDRATQLSLAVDQPVEAAEAFARWGEASTPIPNDRRVQWIGVTEDAGQAASLAVEVLRSEPNREDVRRALERHGAATLADVGRMLLNVEDAPADTATSLAAAALLTAGDADAEALNVWRALVATAPADAELAHRAEMTFSEDPAALLSLSEARLPSLPAGEQVALLYRMAALEATDEGRESRWLAVLEADLSELPARRALIAQYAGTGRDEEREALLEELTTFAVNPDERWEAWIAIADLRAASSGRGDGVREALEHALRIRPTDADVLQRLERAYAEAEDVASLASLIVRRADTEQNLDRKVELLRTAARKLERDADSPSDALPLLDRILAFEPANLPVLEDKARLEAALERWEDVLHTLDRMAQHAPVEELRADILVRGFRVLHHRLGRSADACALLAAALQTIEVPEADRVAFRDAAEAGGAWQQWVLGTRAAIQRAGAQTAGREELDASLVELADVMHHRTEQSGEALGLLVESLLSAPALDARLSLAERIAAEAGLRTHLVDVYRALMDAHPDSASVLDHGIQATAAIALDLGRPAVAFDIHMRGLEHTELRDAARATLRDLAEAHGLWDRYRDVLDDDTGEVHVGALLERAQVERERLNDWRAALSTLVEAFEQSPFAPEVMDAITALCESNDAWPNLLQSYETLATKHADLEQRIRMEMADISERIGESSMGIAQHVLAWKVVSDDEDAWAALQARAIRLERLDDLAKAGAWKLGTDLDAEAMHAWSLRTQAAAIAAARPDRALAALTAYVSTHAPTTTWVTAAAEAWTPDYRIDGFDWAMQLGAQVERVASTAFEAATTLATTPLQSALAAEARYNAAPTPSNRRAWITALVEAERIADARDAWASWATERTEVSEVREALLEAHALGLRIGESPAAAADRLAGAAFADSDDDALFDAWASSAAAAERWAALATALAERASKRDEAGTWLRVGSLFEESLGDPERALEAILTGLTHVTDDLPLAKKRTQLLATLERWREYVTALETLSDTVGAAESAQLLAQAAEAAELQLTDTRMALDLLERACRADASWATPFLERARLHRELGATSEAAACQHEGVARLREEQATSPNPRRMAAALAQLATMVNDDDAVPLLRESAALDPSESATRVALFATLRRLGDLDGVLTVIDEALRDAQGADAGALLLERANVLLHDAKRPTDAARTLERARSHAGESPGIHAITGDFHLLAERWDDAYASYRAALGPSESLSVTDVPSPRPTLPCERVERTSASAIYLSRAATAAENAGLTREAQELFGAANLEDERDSVALLGLARLAVKRGAADAALVYLGDLQAGPDSADNDLQEAVAALKERAGL